MSIKKKKKNSFTKIVTEYFLCQKGIPCVLVLRVTRKVFKEPFGSIAVQ